MIEPVRAGTATLGSPARKAPRGSRGQVIVIFAGAMLLFAMLAAAVIDLSWYWTNNLRMQRAADAAALAGVVFLPGDPASAISAARVEAAKNGYQHGTGSVVVTPVQDPINSRRLIVTISGNVGTFFARVAGITSWPASRTSKSEFVLPVPMGSPQNYYGVGFYERRTSTTTPVNGNTDWNPASSLPSSGQWGNADRAYTNNDSYTTEDTTNHVQQWSNFNLQADIPDDGTLVIDGLRVRLQDARLTGSGTGTSNCRIQVGLSWNGGSSWTSYVSSDPITTSDTDPVLGSNSSLAAWTSGPATWNRGHFANGTFRVRLRWQDDITNCHLNRAVQLDQLEVNVQYHTTTTTWSNQTLSVPDPSGGTLAPQGFWGAMFTSGGVRENGDQYGPANLGGSAVDAPGPGNPDYDPDGYDYTVELPGGSGQVRLFDPIFCATGDNGHGGSYGAGDHWTGRQGGGTVVRPVGVTYRLYNTQGTVANTDDDGPPVGTLTYDPGAQTLADLSGAFGTPQGPDSGQPAHTDCSSHPAHHQWVSIASGLVGGVYRLNVNTTLDPDNANVGAENLFSVWVQSGGSARVFGSGRMAAYSNLDGGLQKFYFAQVEQAHAGKTMQIDLFDPGETNGDSFLRLLSPDGNSFDYVTFDWTSDDGRSGTNVSEIQTSDNGALFNNKMITISVPLPATYGSAGLDPPGDITTEAGWWLIEYNINAANDTTTWGVSIRGNPVHLVLP